MFTEYVGLAQPVASLIESFRREQAESKNDILARILPKPGSVNAPFPVPKVDFGQGVELPVGERLYLYLYKPDGSAAPDAVAEVAANGLILDGQLVQSSSRGKLLAPAMHTVQRQKGHLNEYGQPKSLSAYRQWHVKRGDKLVALDRLKSPDKARKRRTKAEMVDVDALLREIEGL